MVVVAVDRNQCHAFTSIVPLQRDYSILIVSNVRAVITAENNHQRFTVGEFFQTVGTTVYRLEVEVDGGAPECESYGVNRR